MSRKERQEKHQQEVSRLSGFYLHLMRTEVLSNAYRYHERNRMKQPQRKDVFDEAWNQFLTKNRQEVVEYVLDILNKNMGNGVNELFHELHSCLGRVADEAMKELACRRKHTVVCS